MSVTERIARKCAKSAIQEKYGLTQECTEWMAKSYWRKWGYEGIQDQDDGLDGGGVHFFQVLIKDILFVMLNIR